MNNSEEQLFNSIFTVNYRSLVYFASTLLKDRMQAEDVVQDVFVEIWDNLARFRNIEGIKPYLYKCVRNLCIDRINRQKKSIVTIPPVEQQLSYILDAETISIIYEAVNTLPESSRKVMQMVLCGKKNAEIAKELNLSSNTVRVHKQRAVATLRKQLKPEIFMPLVAYMFGNW